MFVGAAKNRPPLRVSRISRTPSSCLGSTSKPRSRCIWEHRPFFISGLVCSKQRSGQRTVLESGGSAVGVEGVLVSALGSAGLFLDGFEFIEEFDPADGVFVPFEATARRAVVRA
jgi:hypothetical protein